MYIITALVTITLITGTQHSTVFFSSHKGYITEPGCDFNRNKGAVQIAKSALDHVTKDIPLDTIAETRVSTACQLVKSM